MVYRFVIMTGERRGQQITVPDDVLHIGRGAGCGLSLNDAEIALDHAIVEPIAAGLRIRDLGSMGKILVNNREVREATLKHGDTVELGRTRLLVQAVVEAEVQRTAGREYLRERLKHVQLLRMGYAVVGAAILAFAGWRLLRTPPTHVTPPSEIAFMGGDESADAVAGDSSATSPETNSIFSSLPAMATRPALEVDPNAAHEPWPDTTLPPDTTDEGEPFFDEEPPAAAAAVAVQAPSGTPAAAPVPAAAVESAAVAAAQPDTHAAPVVVTPVPDVPVAKPVAEPVAKPAVAVAAPAAKPPAAVAEPAAKPQPPATVDVASATPAPAPAAPPRVDPAVLAQSIIVDKARGMVAEANRLALQNRQQEADDMLSSVERMLPEYAEAYAERARLYEERGMLDPALAQWREVLAHASGAELHRTAETRIEQLERARHQIVAKFAGRVKLMSTEQKKFPDNERMREMRTVTVRVQPGVPVDAADARAVIVEVLFYDRDPQSGRVAPSKAGGAVSHLSVPGPWREGEVKTVTATYTIPAGVASAPARAEQFYGYAVRVYHHGALQAAVAEPPALLSEATPWPGDAAAATQAGGGVHAVVGQVP